MKIDTGKKKPAFEAATKGENERDVDLEATENNFRENIDEKKPILILGGTGKTGSRIASRLKARGLPIRIGSRSGKPPFDWNSQTTWLPCLQNVKSIYITYYPDLALPGAAEAIGSLAALAVENGVKRLVLLSGRGEEEAQRSEQALRNSGAEWTILRSSWFSQNFSESFLLESVGCSSSRRRGRTVHRCR